MTGRLDEPSKVDARLTRPGLIRADHRLGNAGSASHVCLREPGTCASVAEHSARRGCHPIIPWRIVYGHKCRARGNKVTKERQQAAGRIGPA
jgi:hypothetical protein